MKELGWGLYRKTFYRKFLDKWKTKYIKMARKKFLCNLKNEYQM